MILVAGSANLDFVVRAPHIPAPGETVMGDGFQTFPGGKGANQAVACARSGGAITHMLLALGNDAYASIVEDSLRSAGVNLHIVRSAAQATGTAFICVSADAENAITVAPGANSVLNASHLPALDGFTHLLMQLEIPIATVLAWAQQAKSQGLVVVLNASPVQDLPVELLRCVDILMVNEGELAALKQRVDAAQVPVVLVTLGKQGCRAQLTNAWVEQPAFAVQAVDTTGAGDTFAGALVAALSKGDALPQAMRFASAAAALACTRMGAQTSIPKRAEVMQFLAAQTARSVSKIME